MNQSILALRVSPRGRSSFVDVKNLYFLCNKSLLAYRYYIIYFRHYLGFDPVITRGSSLLKSGEGKGGCLRMVKIGSLCVIKVCLHIGIK